MTNLILFGPTPLSLRPLAWWRFDDGSGSTAVDSSGRGHDLTLSNMPTRIAGRIGGGLNFAAASSEKGETSAAALLAALQGLSTLTIAFWARAAAYEADKGAIAIRNGVDYGTMLLILPYDLDGTPAPRSRVFYAGTSIIPAGAAAPLDTWNHFAFVQRSSTDHELFINNVSVGKSSTEKSLPAAISAVSIASDGELFFNGDKDEVFIFDRALTALELAALYQWNG